MIDNFRGVSAGFGQLSQRSSLCFGKMLMKNDQKHTKTEHSPRSVFSLIGGMGFGQGGHSSEAPTPFYVLYYRNNIYTINIFFHSLSKYYNYVMTAMTKRSSADIFTYPYQFELNYPDQRTNWRLNT